MNDNDKFPDAPGFKEKDGCSQDAAEQMKATAPRLRTRCLELIRETPAGLTAEEVVEKMGWELCSIRARVSELFALGKVAKHGRRPSCGGRSSATVWIATIADEAEAA